MIEAGILKTIFKNLTFSLVRATTQTTECENNPIVEKIVIKFAAIKSRCRKLPGKLWIVNITEIGALHVAFKNTVLCANFNELIKF